LQLFLVGVLQKKLKSANFRPCALKLNITVRANREQAGWLGAPRFRAMQKTQSATSWHAALRHREPWLLEYKKSRSIQIFA
jgi:hypothetical protein